jgi:hypothetical protein
MQCKEVTRLSLVAPALLDNATPLALSLELPDAGPSIAAPPQQATPSSWQSLRQRPRQACLALQLPGAEVCAAAGQDKTICHSLIIAC